jgi:hypothetical protein
MPLPIKLGYSGCSMWVAKQLQMKAIVNGGRKKDKDAT